MGTVWLSPGAQATAEKIIADIDALLPRSAALLGQLGEPVLCVVPSAALQLHYSALLSAQGPRLGLRVLTLYALATEVLAYHGEIPRRGAEMARVLARRFAAEEPVLAADLEHLSDGYSAAVESVRDLLSAGFEPIHLEATDELLSNTSAEEAAIAAALGLPLPAASSTKKDGTAEQRAAAVLRVAAQVYETLDLLKVGDRSWVFRRAAELLVTTPPLARAVRVAGFAEASGLMSDFIEGLMRWWGAEIVIDRPADPAAPWREDAGVIWADRLVDRLRGVGEVVALERENPPPERALFDAPGTAAEVREVARRVRALLDGGAVAERIGVVARVVEPFRPVLWRELRRLGIPFSGLEAVGSDSVEARRVGALLDVIMQGDEARADRWLEACGWLTSTRGEDERDQNRLRRADLMLALSAAGASRLHEVAAVIPASEDAGGVSLPVREGMRDDGPVGGVRVRKRSLPLDRLHYARQRAASLCAFWSAWPEKAPLQVHVRLLRSLLIDELVWSGEPIAAREVFDAAGEMLRVHEKTLTITLDEFRLLCASHLRPIGRAPLGGQGGGVQVLSAVEARGLTFEHLFVVGLNRDIFPHRAPEDALLPDQMRRRLQVLVPTLPLRLQMYMGERHLFAWLHTATRNLTLSWQRMDEDGKPIVPSPLVERLRWSQAGTVEAQEEAPPLHSGLVPPGPELAFDAAIRAGLHGSRERFAAVLAVALAERRPPELSEAELDAAAAARLRILEALEPDPRSEASGELDPFSGLVGPMFDDLDPRRNALYITALEKTARCPWQSYLLQVLRVEPVPDPAHNLPHVEKWMLGDLVHRVLELVVQDALGQEAAARTELTVALKLGPVEVSWPDEAALESAVLRAAREVTRLLGLNLPGMVLVLRDMALPFLTVAREIDWPDRHSRLPVLGVEIEGEVPASAGGRPVFFKADRADLHRGQLRLTDYKTGRPIDRGRRAETRERNFLRQVRSGQRLQASTYTLARAPGVGARLGRFLFLDPETEAHSRDFSVEDSDPDFIDATGAAFSAVIAGWDRGLFFPRLVDPRGRRQSPACKTCDVRQACRLGDSGYRQRLTGWVQRHTNDFKAGGGPEMFGGRALLRLWWLGEDPPDYDDKGRAQSTEEMDDELLDMLAATVLSSEEDRSYGG